jgi:formylglycine-generating enzyme required for sulfatase activity
MRLAAAIAFVLANVLGATPEQAQTWVALVISNAHQNARQTHDARDIGASPERFGFPVRRDSELKMAIAADQEATAPLSAVEEQALKPMDNFKECAQCPEMVVVPAGGFTMGSPDSEEGRIEEEGPQHRVTFGKSFGVGRFAVTFEEWDA